MASSLSSGKVEVVSLGTQYGFSYSPTLSLFSCTRRTIRTGARTGFWMSQGHLTSSLARNKCWKIISCSWIGAILVALLHRCSKCGGYSLVSCRLSSFLHAEEFLDTFLGEVHSRKCHVTWLMRMREWATKRIGSHRDDIVEKSLWIEPKLQHQRKGSNVECTCILAQATTNKNENKYCRRKRQSLFSPSNQLTRFSNHSTS